MDEQQQTWCASCFYCRMWGRAGAEVRSGALPCPTCHQCSPWRLACVRRLMRSSFTGTISAAACAQQKRGALERWAGKKKIKNDLAYILTPIGHRALAFVASLLAGLLACQPVSQPVFLVLSNKVSSSFLLTPLLHEAFMCLSPP